MNRFNVRKVAVLGAGVMGAQIAAHLVNLKLPVLLFDLTAKSRPEADGIRRPPPEGVGQSGQATFAQEGDPNAIVLKALDGLKKLKPSPIGVVEDIALIQTANYDQHLELLRGCDLIIEAIAERMD